MKKSELLCVCYVLNLLIIMSKMWPVNVICMKGGIEEGKMSNNFTIRDKSDIY